ncbi:hypothetical protein K439DRAFT_1148849 [Ramaria rubella]|nr:hypothetical protein K439DRAFT_1148849 [Ramaria rubella]
MGNKPRHAAQRRSQRDALTYASTNLSACTVPTPDSTGSNTAHQLTHLHIALHKHEAPCQHIEHAQNRSCAPALQTTPANRATSTLISRTRVSFDATSDLDPVPAIVEYVPPLVFAHRTSSIFDRTSVSAGAGSLCCCGDGRGIDTPSVFVPVEDVCGFVCVVRCCMVVTVDRGVRLAVCEWGAGGAGWAVEGVEATQREVAVGEQIGVWT